jgi:outer membrane protein TolC
MYVLLVFARRSRLRLMTTLMACLIASTFAAAADTRPLAFADALQIAEQRSARIDAQQAAVDAVSEQVGRAGELPDPKLRFGLDNVPVSNPDAFSLTRDFMTMRRVGVMQEMPNAAKRGARVERARHERFVEIASLEAQRAQVRQDIAVAWLDLYYAQQSERVLGDLEAAYKLEAETTAPAVSSGRMTTSAALGARVAVASLRDRILEQQRSVARTRATLRALVGEPAERPLSSPPDVTRLAHAPDAFVSGVDAHPAQRIYEEREALAASEIALAASTRRPDWSWEVSFGQREPRFSNMVTVMVSMDLPLRKGARQDRDVATRVKQLDQARAQREDARRMHEAEVRNLIADWQFAGERVRQFERGVLPLTREKSDLTLAAYRGGRGELASVLEARRAITEVELSKLSAELEQARAWARLNYLIAHGEKQ